MHNNIIWMIRFSRIRLVVTCCVFVFLFAKLVTYMRFETFIKGDDKMFVKTELDAISCYYMNDKDVLPSAEDPSFSPKDKSIFFIDATCNGILTMMQACVAEAAAISNPERHIYVLLSFPITDLHSKRLLAELLKNPNVNVVRIHVAQFAKGTAMESLLVNDIKKSKHPIEDTSHILKIVTLHKWGGIYMDSDMIAIRSFEDLPDNLVAKQANGVSTGIFSFAKDDIGTNITGEILKDLAMTYDPKSRRLNRSEAILIRVLKRICPNAFTSKFEECYGLTVFSEDLFYPLLIPPPAELLEESGVEVDDIRTPYTFPLRSMDFSSYQTDEQLSLKFLAKVFCPGLFKFKLSLE